MLVSYLFLSLHVAHFVKKVAEATANFAQSRISRKKWQQRWLTLLSESLHATLFTIDNNSK